MTIVGAIFAHQGGWDEIAMVLGPLALLFVMLLLANKRARALSAARADGPDDTGDALGSGVDARSDGSPPSPSAG